ncbi:ATPase AAA-2 domain-containing protein [Alicyclobacillus hesperidum URH17-3-68]|nr:ATPase AAA-2 domain-containing protein [Alicyclobacillus hesperidum URH17-3-68]
MKKLAVFHPPDAIHAQRIGGKLGRERLRQLYVVDTQNVQGAAG